MVASKPLVHGVGRGVVLMLLVAGCTRNKPGSDSSNVSQSGVSTASADTMPKPAANIALPVTVEPARDGDLVLSIITSGQVRSERESHLKAEVGGTVQRVDIRPGQSVKKGQTLIEFDPRPFDLVARQRQADVDKAMLSYFDMWLPDSIATGRGPGEDRKRAAMTRSGLDGAKLNLEQAKLDRERATIVAPFDGVVDRVEVAEGERVGAGQATVTVVDIQHLRIEAAVLEHDIPVIKEGGIATVASAASPNVQEHGQIVAVLAIVDSATHSGRAYVRLAGNGVLRPGMSVDVRLEAKRLTNRRLVPKKAVIERDGRPLVFVVHDGRADWVYINRGRDNGTDTEVLPDSITNEPAVKVGDLVITQGHLTLTHQAPVRVIKKEDRP
jgi:membrane fusion protein, multidrug efflux system